MVVHIRNAEADRIVRELASKLNLSIPKAVRRAVENELREMDIAAAAARKQAIVDGEIANTTKLDEPNR